MSITVLGPTWPSVDALRSALADVPESGTFQAGGTKLLATEQMERFRAAGVRTPEWTRDLDEACRWVTDGATVFGRRERHSQGSDIVLPSSRRWEHRQWWSKFVPSVAEWRIHVFDGRSIARGLKTYRGDDTTTLVHPIRSRSRGWIMIHTERPSAAIRSIAKSAVASLGYLYGAVDILVTDDSSPVVLEVNRLPAMDAYTRDRYVRAIRRYVGGTTT